MLLKVEVVERFHTGGIAYVAEVAEAIDVDALALRHAGVHYAGDAAQDGLHVEVRYGGNLRQVFGDGFRFHRVALHHSTRVVHLLLLVIRFLVEWHNSLVLLL